MVRLVKAIAVFAACAAVSKLAPSASQVLLKALLIGASLLLIRLEGRTLADCGFVKPAHPNWWKILAPGLLTGALSSFGALAFGFDGMRKLIGTYSLWQLLLAVFLWSSLSEEIFCRGWFQRESIVQSAALFGLMHTSLFFVGVDTPSVLWVVASTTVLGYVCAQVRAEYGSWIPAFVRHAGFNFGGPIGGIVYTIAYRLITGHIPTFS
jgi:membrane protease YdiL (CAAX protease family)